MWLFRNTNKPLGVDEKPLDLFVHAALRDLGFSGKGEMKTSSLGRTARPCAAVDRYQAIDFDEPHRKSVRNTAPKCARQSRMPRPSHGLPPISIALRQYTSNQRYMKTCQPTHAHTRLGLIRMSRHLKMTFALKKLIKCRDMSRHLPKNFDI